LAEILSGYGVLNEKLLLILCDAVRFFGDATRFFHDALRFFCDALRHQLLWRMSKFDKYDRINSLKATSLFYVLSTESEQFVKSPTLLTVPLNSMNN
jgi:hypothetical protein